MTKLLEQLAATCARALPEPTDPFDAGRGEFGAVYAALVDALRTTDPRFEFDLAGRPSALAAVRHALPAMEAELLDAIFEDVRAELAAHQEALFRIAVAVRQGS
jgi:hypothetical protein